MNIPPACGLPPHIPPHPLLRESNVQLINLKIGTTLQQLIVEAAEAKSQNVNSYIREILAENMQPTFLSAPTFDALTPTKSLEKQTYEAFANQGIIDAIRSVAKCIDEDSIECTSQNILSHFLSFCPQV